MCYDRASKTLTHTEVLPLFPAPFAQNPSTDGITALVRLGDYTADIDDEEMFYPSIGLVHLSTNGLSSNPTEGGAGPGLAGHTLPLQIFPIIASFLYDGSDLASFALASYQTLSASLLWLKYPQIVGRTTDTPILISFGPPLTEDFGRKSTRIFTQVYSTIFYQKKPMRDRRGRGEKRNVCCYDTLLTVYEIGPDW